MKVKTISVMFLMALFLFPVTGLATQINSIQGNEGLGAYTGNATFKLVDSTHAQLSVEIKNTSQNSNEGYITAIAFFLPNQSISVTGVNSSDADFNYLTIDNKDTKPYAGFNFGASISNQWEGGGNPQPGIATGDSATFTFNLTGTGLSNLSINDFVKTVKKGDDVVAQNAFMAARFKGFADGGSDKVLAVPAIQAVPEPATIILLTSGIIGAALTGLKRKKQK